MDYYIKKTNEIKRVIENSYYPTLFKPNEWKRRNKDTNCYAYALNIPVGDSKQKIWIPGCISNPKVDLNIYSSNELIERLYEDLEYLKLKYEESNRSDDLEKFLISVYMIPSSYDYPIGFHFSRLDSDKSWSEKPSWDKKVRKVKIINPETFERKEDGLYLVKTLKITKK